MSTDSIYKTYAQLLKWHQKGHALWEPIRSDRLRLGSVGYFDYKGRWDTIFPNIQDVPLPMENFTKEVTPISESSDTVREFTSRNLENIKLNLGVSLNAMAMSLPLQIDAAINRENHLEAYAFLHCGKLQAERAKIDPGALREWGKTNAKHILAIEPSTKKYGFFVVTAIHRVQRCQLKCWMKHTKSISPSISARPSPVPLTGSLEGSQVVDSSQSGWVIRPSDDDLSKVRPFLRFSNYLFAEPEYIVFVEGLLFASHVYGLVTKVTEDVVWRGSNLDEGDDEDSEDDDAIDVELDDDDNTYKVVCEDWLPMDSDGELPK